MRDYSLKDYMAFATETVYEAGRLTLGYFHAGVRPRILRRMIRPSQSLIVKRNSSSADGLKQNSQPTKSLGKNLPIKRVEAPAIAGTSIRSTAPNHLFVASRFTEW